MAPGPALPPAALSLHREATVVDLHNDLMLEVQAAKRDITIRSSTGHSDLPRLREGGVDGQCFALFVHPKEADRGFARVTELLDAFDRLAAANDAALGRATSVAEIERLQQAGRLAVVLAIENGSALGDDLHHLDAVYERGVRMMSLTWNNSNGLADGAMESRHGGLTPLGQRVLNRMQELAMVVDVSHLSEKSFWDTLAVTRGPIVATHSNAAALTPHPRHLNDEQLRLVARPRRGVGGKFYPPVTRGAARAPAPRPLPPTGTGIGADPRAPWA